ncbi:MAG: hypothetical protein OXT09_01360 [Myxococcales bacterium]|nr:hypothetical protein [Myxococcales bacterium]
MTPTGLEGESAPGQAPESVEFQEVGPAAEQDVERLQGTDGQSAGDPDPIEQALADALRRATERGEWSAVEAITRELTARREARAGVVDLAAERARRGKHGRS